MTTFRKFLFTATAFASLCTAVPVRAEFSQGEFNKMMEKYLETQEGKKTVGSTVESYFKERQEMARKNQEELAKAEMEKQFTNPVKIDVGNSPVKGPKDARVTIIEFSDFQCPYCTRANETVKEIVKAYPKDVKIVFKNLPLPFHKEADPAARAALAAGKQGKFWEMHDALFANQASLKADFYTAKAKELGLDVEKFKKDMESDEIKNQVKEDANLAQKHGISGTPGFFVNGVAVKGAYPFDHFKQIIDRWLETKQG